MADITEIKRGLADQAQWVAGHLLSGGKKVGHEFRAGSVSGGSGKSLAVELRGVKAGLWSDFATGEGGDLLDLWCASQNVTLPEALKQARAYLGIADPEPDRKQQKSYRRPAKPTCNKPRARVADYLREDRNLPDDMIQLYQIGEDGADIIFPYLLPDGTLALVKRRKAVDGASPIPTEADCEPCLFGWQTIPDDAREIVLTEGELDAPSWRAYGHFALSVPFGGGGGNKQKWIENDYHRLQRFERIYIATDMDDEGEAAALEIAARLGRHRCFRVAMPRKDGNKCLVDGVSKEDMDACIADAQTMDPDGLKRAASFKSEVQHLFWPAPGEHVGYRTPYRKLRDRLLFRPAELTLWSGPSGSGKSQILCDCTVDWIEQGSRVCLSSLEMKPGQTLKRMVKQTTGIDRPTSATIGDAVDWLDAGLLLYERVGKAGIENLLEIFNYARAKYGCDQFAVDSFMRLGIPVDDYNAQEKALFKLVDWTIANNVHLHLVAHTRKGDGSRPAVPQTEDVKGAMEIGANAFNIITVWRNRQHEELLETATDADEIKQLSQKPPVVLNIAKQRNGDFEGKVGLWFNKSSYRYHSSHDRELFDRDYLKASPPAVNGGGQLEHQAPPA